MNAVVNQTAVVPYNDMRAMAKDIAASGLFGMKNDTQVLALMLVAQAEGRHPASVARDYDIIQGRPAKKAEAMLRDFLQNGGRVEWHELTDAKASATFSHPSGGAVRIDWDMARMKAAKIANDAMYSKYPRQMLRSRCVSEGVRTVFPAATGGLNVPEEIRTVSVVQNGSVIEGEAIEVEQSAPEGYLKWHADMAACADEGTARLQEAWKASSAEFRKYVVKNDEAWWNEMKDIAAKVQP